MTSLDGVIDGIVDAHLHQWNPRRTPWAANRLTRLYRFLPRFGDRVFPLVASQADREYVLTPATVSRIYEPPQYVDDAVHVSSTAGVPINTVVHVESHWRSADPSDPAASGESTVDETRYVASLPFGVHGAPRLGGIVVNGDPRSGRFADQLDQHAAVSDRLRGVRLCVARHPDPRVRDFVESDGVLVSQDFLTGFEAIAERGLTFDVSLYSHQLYDVVTLAREFPGTTIVVDHLGTPVGVFGPVGMRTGDTAAARADILGLWRERIVTLAAYPNVVFKMSGLGLPILGYGRARWGNIGTRDTLTEMIGPLATHVLDHVGPQRVMWGSNFPVDSPNASLEMGIGALLDLFGDRGEYVLRNLFRDNALRVYNI